MVICRQPSASITPTVLSGRPSLAPIAAGSPITIGRETDNTIVITDDTFISGHHSRITFVGGSVLLDDLASKNGTYLNGSPISQQRTVHTGDRIQVGYTVLEAQ